MYTNDQSFNRQELSKEIYAEISRLNKEGTAKSRERLVKLEETILYWKKRIEDLNKWKYDHESSNKSDLVSVKHGSKLIAEELIPKQNEKISLAITYSKDAIQCTAEANKAAQKAVLVLQESQKDNKKFLIGLWVSLFLMVGTSIYTHSLTVTKDTVNQVQLVKYLEKFLFKLEKIK